MRVFEQKFALKDAIGSHAFAPLESSQRVTNNIPLGSSSLSYRVLHCKLCRNTEGRHDAEAYRGLGAATRPCSERVRLAGGLREGY